MIKIGIVGLPNVGKSTLFKALTQNQVTIANYPFATIDPNVGIVEVPDERLQALARLSNSAKIIPAIIEFYDIAGLVKGASQGLGLGNAFLTHIRNTDAILHLIRAFENSEIIHVENHPDPERDFEIITLELVLKDLDVTQKALEKANSEAKSGAKEKIKRKELLEKLKKILENSQLLFNNINSEEAMLANEIGLLTQKPMLVVFNISEKQFKENWRPSQSLKDKLGAITYFTAPIGLEAELADQTVSSQEKNELYQIAGIQETSLDALVKKSYQILGLMTFLTTGLDETRAWTIPLNAKAPRAGRAIHSDFEEKFIRAEVIHWDKLVEAGSYAKARELGQLHIEGKEYIVQDGDVIEFRI